MAKIEINEKSEKLERISIFLTKNNIQHIELILSTALTYKVYMLHVNFVSFFNRSYGYIEKNLLHYSIKAKLFG